MPISLKGTSRKVVENEERLTIKPKMLKSKTVAETENKSPKFHNKDSKNPGILQNTVEHKYTCKHTRIRKVKRNTRTLTSDNLSRRNRAGIYDAGLIRDNVEQVWRWVEMSVTGWLEIK